MVLTDAGINLDKAYLYGSYSNNTATDESNIDLLIVSNKFDNANDNLIGKIWYLTRKFDTKIEPYIVSTQRFDSDENSPLIQLVKNEGMRIV